MEGLYQQVRQDNLDDPKALSQKLQQLLEGPVVEEEGCLFLAQLRSRVPGVKLADFQNRTAYECYVNHIHVEDYSENGGFAPLVMLGRGMAVAQKIRDRLAAQQAGKHFQVIVNFDNEHCDVRFHAVRLDEDWIGPDLEEYPQEALAVLDTASMREQI